MRKTAAKSATIKRRFWSGHIDGWQQSGRSQRKYCVEHGLAISTFQLWRRRLSRVLPTNLEVVALPPLPQVQRPADAPLVLILAGGRGRLEIGDGVNAETLRTVLDALGVR